MKQKKRKQPKIVMLVNNACTYDTRVIKQAETLAKNGYDITVICKAQKDLANTETINHVKYQRVRTAKNIIKIGQNIIKKLKARYKKIAKYPRKTVNLFWPIKNNTQTTKTQSKVNHSPPQTDHLTKHKLMYKIYEINIRPTLKKLKPDIIHAHDLTTLPCAANYARKYDVKLIYDAHELYAHANGINCDKLCNLIQSIENEHIQQAQQTITVCESIANHIVKEHLIQPPNIIYNSPYLSDTSDNLNECCLRSDLNLFNDTPLAIYIGIIAKNRGCDLMVEALKHINYEMHLVALGPQKQDIKQQMIDIAKKHNLQNQLHFLNAIAPNKVSMYASSADFSIIPIQKVCLNHEFAMPNKLFESVMAGLPLAVANLTEMRRFVEHWNIGYKIEDQANPKSIAETMMKVYDQRDQLKPDEHKLAQIAEQYSWQAQEKKLIQIYEDLKNK